jgi:hypothetical protein
MGRARGHVVAGGGFDAVLGTRRGSALAQAERDASEEREHARTRAQEREMLGSLRAA